MKQSDQILKRQAIHVRFQNKDMDFLFNWLLGVGAVVGLSHGELFQVVDGMKDGDPKEWRERFTRHGDFRAERAAAGRGALAAQDRLAAAFAYRAALHFCDPTSADFTALVERMDARFVEGARGLGVPLSAVEVPFEGHALPGYILEHDATPRPLLVMVGGGDTFREDLFYFAGYPAWRRGYNAVMVDLPGQGVCPSRGLTFRADMAAPISAVIDFAQAKLAAAPAKVALYGVSGGGYFTAQAAASDPRVGAWVASTPITDMAEVFRKEFGAALHAPGWLLRLGLKMAGAVNEAADLALKKYAWQFGTADFRAAVDGVFAQARVVDTAKINCPSLFLVGDAEGAELERQAFHLSDELGRRGVDVTLRLFRAHEGGEVHCQVNNLRLAHAVIFDWLDRVVLPPPPPSDPRLLAW